MVDGGTEHPHYNSGTKGRDWDLKNARLVDSGLSQMNNALGGSLKDIIGSATFTLNTHPNIGGYFGYNTNLNVDFYTNSTIPFQNLFHEFGHVLDNATGSVFSKALESKVYSSPNGEYWFGGNGAGTIKPSLVFKSPGYVTDPNWGLITDVLQDPDKGGVEQWGDIWANYVAGNIDQEIPAGAAMYSFAFTQILPYIK